MGRIEPVTARRGTLARLAWRVGRFRRPLIEVDPPPTDIRTEWNVPVVMRDGVTLRANVFRPATDEPVPAIMSVHPYNKDNIPANGRNGKRLNIQYRMLPQPHPIRYSGWTGWEAPDPAVWVPRGYAIVNADMRGGGKSDGVGHLFSDEEARDYAELISWAADQSWCTGKVGLDGVSYLAISQYKVAALGPEHLAAICPWEGFSDLYRDFVYPGGVRENGFSRLWTSQNKKKARLGHDYGKEVDAHSERDQFYEALTPDLPAITVPMLVCGSFSDHSLHTRGSFELFRRSGSTQKWLYTHRDGKWAAYYGPEATETRATFFDHFLRGIDNGWEQRPAVRLAIYERGPDPVDVRLEAEWPPADLTWSTLYLSQRGLREDLGPGSRSSYENQGNGASFDWELPADLDVIGPMALRLYLSTVGNNDPFVFVAVRKLHDGAVDYFEGSLGFNRDVVTTGWQRAAFRELDEQLSAPYRPVHTFRKAEPLQEGEIVPVDIELREHATRLRKGDVLRLEVRGHWHFPNNPVTGQWPVNYQSSKQGSCIIHLGNDHPSALLLGHRPAGTP
jgi:predicted acyl esterase